MRRLYGVYEHYVATSVSNCPGAGGYFPEFDGYPLGRRGHYVSRTVVDACTLRIVVGTIPALSWAGSG
jgi:hypothetical protein